MNQTIISATVPSQSSQPKAEANGETLDAGIVEGIDDPELRRFLDQRSRERESQRLAQPPTWHDDPPTPKQIAYLRFLGYRGKVKTKGEAAKAIEELLDRKK